MTEMTANTNDPNGYSKMTIEELRTRVTNLVEANNQLEEDRKEYSRGTNEVIKDNKKAIKQILAIVKAKRQSGDITKTVLSAATTPEIQKLVNEQVSDMTSNIVQMPAK